LGATQPTMRWVPGLSHR